MGQGYRFQARANAEAEIFIYEDVGEGFFGGVSAKQFASDLRSLGDVAKITLHINSEGGDVFDGLAIYRLLADHKAKVVSQIDGVAASIASVIAMAGNEIRIAESGFLMIHDAWGLKVGNSDDMRSMADLLDATTGSLADVYMKRTNAKAETIRKWMKDETWFTGAEAVKEGFADSIVENLRVAARLDSSKHKYKRAPAALTARPLYLAASERIARARQQIEQRKINELRAA